MSRVEIYTKSGCPFCARAKAHLDAKGVAYHEIDVTTDTVRELEMQRRAGRTSVPQIFVGDHHVGGSDDLIVADQLGRLDALVNGNEEGVTGMKQHFVDVAVIGAGSAGLRAFRAASTWTDNVVLIEGGAHGTTCARVGCMPSKLLIAAAEAAHAVAQAPAFGIDVGALTIDGAAVMQRVRNERDRFVGFVVDGVERIPAHQRITGYARFLSDHQLQIDDHTIVTAKRIVIATGSTSSVPPAFAELGDRLIVNDDIFEWRDLPKSVAVFGPGVIGLELGQALSRLGTKVTMFGRGGPVGPLTDPTLLEAARAEFSNEFYLDADATVHRMQRMDTGVRIEFETPQGEAREIVVDYVIAATGRTPNVANLALTNTHLPLDERGIPVFDPATMRIGQSHVFIAGDVNNDRPLLHEAVDEGQIAGDNAGCYPEVLPRRRRTPLGIVFSDPQIAIVGERYADLAHRDIVIGEVSFEDQGRSRVMLKNQGALRLYADARDGRLLGAEMFGPRAEHIGHLLAWAHQADMTLERMLEMPYYHPVVEEGLRTALRDAQEQLSRRRRDAAGSFEGNSYGQRQALGGLVGGRARAVNATRGGKQLGRRVEIDITPIVDGRENHVYSAPSCSRSGLRRGSRSR